MVGKDIMKDSINTQYEEKVNCIIKGHILFPI